MDQYSLKQRIEIVKIQVKFSGRGLYEDLYTNAPQTIQRLKTILKTVGEIELQLCKNVMKNFLKRMTIYEKSRGSHLADIAFHV
ncbi:hypothetical protein ALC62_09682 [Cyphomyrmex costatus]|uniref:Uncharacterized protein n=1 Tax=Cyphomyrmex costatus TaxID=456900 RepID=A0A151IF54_9HYME|nr:hypothetical protein ALC62_09682 [Cyphomyrmex costatus]